MFKRANKITALLVAAASIMSVVPAMAASSRLETKDGTIEKAIMFKDGKYIYQGYKTDGDTTSIYYNDGTKDKEIEDISEGELGTIFGASSVTAQNSDNDDYMVDLTSGKTTDEDTVEDLTSTAQDNLESKLKKTDRYGDYTVINSLTQIQANEFGDVWYQYKATTAGSAGTKADPGKGDVHYGYANKDGKTYIDASVLANVRVFNGSKMVKIEKFDADKFTDGVKAHIASEPVTVAQDKDNFYRVIKVNFEATTGTKLYDSEGKNQITSKYYLQKVAKAQGDKEDDAYLPKTVESYELYTPSDDVDDAEDCTTANVQLGNAVTYAGLDDSSKESNAFVDARAIDGVLYITSMKKKDRVIVYKLTLSKNEKIDNAITGDKVDTYIVKSDTDVTCDVSGVGSDFQKSAVSIDANGNTWAINEGKIYESVKAGDFKEMYTCDRSLDTLEVYDENSLMAWADAGDVYTTVKEGKDAAKATDQKDATVKPAPAVVTPAPAVVTPAPAVVTPAPAVVTPAPVAVKAGWNKAANGTWTYLDATGAKAVSKWVQDGAKWYYLGADGVMKTNAWVQDGANWYYVGGSGEMLTNTYVGSYWVDGSGAWVK